MRNAQKAQNIEPEEDRPEQQPIRDGFLTIHGKPKRESNLRDAEVNSNASLSLDISCSIL
jgi:hypothetical protein